MIVTGHQPNYLPYPAFFEKIAWADRFVLVDNTQFVKRGPFGWIHRNRIRSRDGWSWLTVPVQTSGKFHQTIAEVLIDNRAPWRRKHFRNLELTYARAPFAETYLPFFQDVYGRPWDRLLDLNRFLIEGLLGLLGIPRQVELASALGIRGEGAGYVLDICRRTEATCYISGMHGKDYLDPEKWPQAGVNLVFQEWRPEPYAQVFPGEFVANLSVVDMLFALGPECGERLRRSAREEASRRDRQEPVS